MDLPNSDWVQNYPNGYINIKSNNIEKVKKKIFAEDTLQKYNLIEKYTNNIINIKYIYIIIIMILFIKIIYL